MTSSTVLRGASRHAAHLAAVVLPLLALSAPARATDLSLQVTDTLIVEYRADNGNSLDDDDEYGILINRLNLSGTAGSLTASLRVDAVGVFEPPSDDYDNDVRLERINVRYRGDGWDAQAGDFYTQLGRGIVLSLRKVDELGVDVSLLGGEFRYRHRKFGLALFGGVTNAANLDTVSNKFVEDPFDALAGLSAELKAIRDLRIEAYGLFMMPEEVTVEGEDDWSVSAGGSVEWLLMDGDWVLYAEAAGQHRTLGGSDETGLAFYLTSDLTLGDFTLLVEGMFLDAFEMKGSRNSALGSRFDYNRPPTLERIDQEVLEANDVAGVRLYGEYSLMDGDLLVHANVMFRMNEPKATSPAYGVHGFAGAEYHYDLGASRFAGAAGYRTELQNGKELKTMGHFELDWIHGIVDNLSLHLSTQNEFRTLTGEPYQRGSVFAGVDWARIGGLTFEFGYDTQFEFNRQFFFAGILSWHVTPRIQLRATGGTQRGGLKCIAGVCRTFPEFAGGRVEVVGRF